MRSRSGSTSSPTTDLPWFVRETSAGVHIRLRVQPKASREAVIGPYGDTLKVSLTAAASDGQANRALISFLSKRLGIPQSAISIVHGESSRVKVVELAGVGRGILSVLGANGD